MSVASATLLDDVLYEVVDGVIRQKTLGVREIQIASLLHGFLFIFLVNNKLGRVVIEMIFRIDVAKDLQRAADVAFVSRSRWALDREVPNAPAWDIVPDLAIEVISPTNAAVGVQTKIHEYFDAGVRAVWVIYPKHKKIHIYASPTKILVLQLGDELDGADVIPGFRLPLRALFEAHAESARRPHAQVH